VVRSFAGRRREVRAAGSYYVCNQAAQTDPTGHACSFGSVGEVDRAAIAAGESVYFAAGDRFSDATLYPRSGVTYGSYTPTQGVGSYGGIRAILAPTSGGNALTFFGASNVTVDGLDLEGGDASTNLGDGVFSSQHSASASTHDVIEHCTIENWARGIQTGYADSDWTIAENTIDTIALDGVYFARSKDRGGVGPQNDVVTGNWIANTGIFPHAGGNTNPVHGIYDNSINSEIANNTISQFQSDGVSVRFRGSRATDNAISGGQIGIAWFQEDPVATTSNWMAM
jgi:Periplasmic copper-binding protein (NosD)